MTHRLYKYFVIQRDIGNKNYLIKWLHWFLFKYLKKALYRYYKDLSFDTQQTDKNSNIIVSLTSIPSRINEVHLVVKSILSQSYKPLKVVLWLGEEKFPNKEKGLPKILLELKNAGLEIEFCKDLKPHTKYYYAFKKYPENLIITLDDDLFYPRNTLEVLVKCYQENANCIIANRVREISYSDGNINSYRNWKINSVKNRSSSYKLLATGVCGVLYNPKCFMPDLFNVQNIERLALNVDDIWLKANEIISEIPVVFTHYFFHSFIQIADSQKNNLHSGNVLNSENDIQIKKIFGYFGISEKSFDR